VKLSIIVPVYNEEQTIAHILAKLIEIKLPCEREIIVINDGSTDGTFVEIEKHIQKKNSKIIRVIHHEKNEGKGTAVKSGMKAAKGDYILIQDADFEYNPEEIFSLLIPIK
jgi:glycosyltransferase involved in cell wall biosynthesis